VVTVHGSVTGVGALGGEECGFGVAHFSTQAEAAEPLLAVLAQLGRRAMVTVPGPHPALPALLAAGWQIEYTDIYMSTDASLLDPLRLCPHPGLA